MTISHQNTLQPMSPSTVHQAVTGAGGGWTDSSAPTGEGRHSVTATYAGSTRFAPSTSTACDHFVN